MTAEELAAVVVNAEPRSLAKSWIRVLLELLGYTPA